MSTIVQIPTHLDGLFVSHPQLVTEAFTDFNRLPFSTSEKDYNPDTVNLSESVMSIPFQNNNLNLKQGMHLHWSLPDALTKGGVGGTDQDYPAVPNRWLISRTSSIVGDKQWIVESDYLHPIDPEKPLENPYNSIAYPIETNENPTHQPFRFLGRQLSANGWTESISNNQKLSKLTAVGYGEPSFAAFYPNCHSVFGCFDPEIDSQNKLTGLSYQLIGWYSDTSQDPLVQLLNDPKNAEADKESLEEAIKNQFRWNLVIDTNNLPQGTTYYANLTFATNGKISNPNKSQATTVSIGNTGTEALSAYISQHLEGSIEDDQRLKIEEQLENLLLQTKLQGNTLDLGPRFQEARHEKGFKAEKGGSLWEVRPANESSEAPAVQLSLPPVMADTLDQLNLAQQEADRALEQFKHQRHILFADWYKYMLCAYPPDDARDDYPDIDYVQWYLQNQTMPKVQLAQTALQEKQAAVQPLQESLIAQVTRFNQSTIGKERFVRKLNRDTADTSGLNPVNTTWQENKPFSTQCLSCNGTNASLSITGQAVKALSLWVNIATQNDNDTVLLATQDNPLMGKDGIADFWNTIAIDGVIQPSYKTLLWHALPKDRWFHLYIELTIPLADTDTIYLFANNNSQYLQGKLASIRLFSEPLNADELYDDQNILGHHSYQLKKVVGPRFWHPTEPVVLLEGDSVTPTTRYGGDGRLNEDNTLDCQITTITNYPLQSADFSSLLTQINNGKPTGGQEKVGYDTWTTQPWHPFLLEWEVRVSPMQEGGNLDVDNRKFNPNFITNNYILEENSPELTVKDGKDTIKAATLYSGRTILTPYAKKELQKTIIKHLDNLKQEEAYQVIGTLPKEQKGAYNSQLADWYSDKPILNDWYATELEEATALTVYRTWYDTKPVYKKDTVTNFVALTDAEKLQDFNYTLIKAYEKANESHYISQALSGFNNALLMHHQTLQLPVNDPLGFEDYQSFTNEVREYISNNTNLAPLPLNDFLPIRSGVMRLLQLRIIDTFGQSKAINPTTITKSEPLLLPETISGKKTDAWLPPRLVQPARINFRWLSAHSGLQELNTHPESTPVCGWLLANHLDNSLAIYDWQGNAIGIIDQEAKWRNVPGTEVTFDPLDVTNIHLRKVIQRLALIGDEEDTDGSKQTFLQDFISVTDKALENIDPESFVHHQELVLLMGRPIAVVRASVNLQLKTDPAIHHGWTEFHQDLMRYTRETDDFEQVKIPIRIGERGQLNDGVVGYWKEDEEQELDTTFHTTVAPGLVNSEAIQSYEDAPLNISQSLSDAPQSLTLLIDPRAEVHATTGILPAKSIHIPKDYYVKALKRISITFLSAPIVMGENQTAIPLPNELGYEWTWLAKDRFAWTEVAKTGILRKDTMISKFENGEALWQQLLDKGWITEIDGNRANIVSTDQRKEATLEAPFNEQADKIQALLDACHIVPITTQATFSEKQTIKEGWLKLSPSEN